MSLELFMLDEANYPVLSIHVNRNSPVAPYLKKDYRSETPNSDRLLFELLLLSFESKKFSLIPYGTTRNQKNNATIPQKLSQLDIFSKATICQTTIDSRDHFRIVAGKDKKKHIIIPIDKKNCVIYKSYQDEAAFTQYLKRDVNQLINKEIPVPEDDMMDVIIYNHESTFDSLGNILASPPTDKHPNGCILYGNGIPNFTETTFRWKSFQDKNDEKITGINQGKYYTKGEEDKDTISDDFSTTLDVYFPSQPKYSYFTGWLEVGHIDEIISFVRHPEGEFGFKILMASPKLFIDMWETMSLLVEKGTIPDKCLFTIQFNFDQRMDGFGDFNKKDKCNDIRYSDFVRYKDNLIKYNLWIHTRILQPIKDKLINDLGISIDDVIDIPILYVGPDQLYKLNVHMEEAMGMDADVVDASKIIYKNFGTYHLSSNFINSVVSTDYMISPFSHCNLPITEYITKHIIRPNGITHIFEVDTWKSVKYQHGGIHCFTIENRDFTRFFQSFVEGTRRRRTQKRQKRQRQKTKTKKI
jgi:hypothetical protein